jgi:large subunit ribosomal protein L10
MKKSDKERVVSELAERLKSSETMLVADYRGLTMPQIDELRGRLLETGARFSVVKNTLTRRAAEEAGADALLALLEGPTAIAFLEAGGDPVAVAKALSQAARETRILVIRGGVLEGRAITGDDVEELAKLPPLEGLRGQVLGAIIAPLTAILGLVTAPVQNLYGLIDARIEQLEAQGAGGGGGGDTAAEAETAAPEAQTEAEPEPEPVPEEEEARAEDAEAEAGEDTTTTEEDTQEEE